MSWPFHHDEIFLFIFLIKSNIIFLIKSKYFVMFSPVWIFCDIKVATPTFLKLVFAWFIFF